MGRERRARLLQPAGLGPAELVPDHPQLRRVARRQGDRRLVHAVARRVVGDLGRRAHVHLHAARGRDVLGRHAAHGRDREGQLRPHHGRGLGAARQAVVPGVRVVAGRRRAHARGDALGARRRVPRLGRGHLGIDPGARGARERHRPVPRRRPRPHRHGPVRRRRVGSRPAGLVHGARRLRLGPRLRRAHGPCVPRRGDLPLPARGDRAHGRAHGGPGRRDRERAGNRHAGLRRRAGLPVPVGPHDGHGLQPEHQHARGAGGRRARAAGAARRLRPRRHHPRPVPRHGRARIRASAPTAPSSTTSSSAAGATTSRARTRCSTRRAGPSATPRASARRTASG